VLCFFAALFLLFALIFCFLLRYLTDGEVTFGRNCRKF
jgi:hypothetical protein